MNIEDQIAALLKEAAALRPLPDDAPEKEPLTAIVDKINLLRNGPVKLPATVEGDDPTQAWADAVAAAKSKPRK